MSGRALDLTQRQVRALCEGARKAGCVAEVVIGKAVVRLIPEAHAIPDEDKHKVEQRREIVM